jgi:hypothetical protein
MAGNDDRVDEPTPGPQDNTDPATKADMGMTGTPARAYSPEGMAEPTGADERDGEDGEDGDEDDADEHDRGGPPGADPERLRKVDAGPPAAAGTPPPPPSPTAPETTATEPTPAEDVKRSPRE